MEYKPSRDGPKGIWTWTNDKLIRRVWAWKTNFSFVLQSAIPRIQIYGKLFEDRSTVTRLTERKPPLSLACLFFLMTRESWHDDIYVFMLCFKVFSLRDFTSKESNCHCLYKIKKTVTAAWHTIWVWSSPCTDDVFDILMH